ncbi:hypothetical protein GCM10009760_26100 [Kitasatospora kazusensis]|uniref:Helix-turn-helix domain-containing protein n=1 Tax=Kitasatospora kazusensis TaxID=407974 RepID=A0ABP5L6P1_9ACTN
MGPRIYYVIPGTFTEPGALDGPDPEVPTKEAWDALIKRYADGESVHALSRELGRSDAWLRRRLVQRGVQLRDRRQAGEALRLRGSGRSPG